MRHRLLGALCLTCAALLSACSPQDPVTQDLKMLEVKAHALFVDLNDGAFLERRLAEAKTPEAQLAAFTSAAKTLRDRAQRLGDITLTSKEVTEVRDTMRTNLTDLADSVDEMVAARNRRDAVALKQVSEDLNRHMQAMTATQARLDRLRAERHMDE